jgi:hypothetical protein
MGNDPKFNNFDLFLHDILHPEPPEDPLKRVALKPLTPWQMAERLDAAHPPVVDRLDVEQAVAQERARRTFLVPDKPVVTINSLGETVIKAGEGAPVAKADYRPDYPDPFLTALTEGVAEPTAAPYDDPEGRALAALGIGAPVPGETAPTLSVPAAPAAGSGLAKAEDDLPCLRGSLADVLTRVAARMPESQREWTRELASLARDYAA